MRWRIIGWIPVDRNWSHIPVDRNWSHFLPPVRPKWVMHEYKPLPRILDSALFRNQISGTNEKISSASSKQWAKRFGKSSGKVRILPNPPRMEMIPSESDLSLSRFSFVCLDLLYLASFRRGGEPPLAKSNSHTLTKHYLFLHLSTLLKTWDLMGSSKNSASCEVFLLGYPIYSVYRQWLSSGFAKCEEVEQSLSYFQSSRIILPTS